MVTFYLPANPSVNIQLRDPIIGNHKKLNLRTKIRRAMSGKIWAYAHQPATIQLELQFEHENRPKIIELINFLRTNAGVQLNYLDHKEVLWLGYILTVPFDETHVGKVNNQFVLDFEGVVVG